MSETTAPTPKELTKKAADEEKVRLLTKLYKERIPSVSDYKSTIKHTGGLLTESMGYAYAKGYENAIKVLTKEDDNVTKA